MEAFLRSVGPDVLVVTPLITPASRQPDLVRSAKALGIPTALGVASWDHLTSKGPVRITPDRVIVWNEAQRREARELHGVADSRIAVTGAQPFDRWFERRPSTTRAEFCRKVGLPEGPFVLFVGSTASISAPAAEQQFVRDWIEALRAGTSPELRQLSVLVRPHPYNPGLWGEADLSGLGNVAVWPRAGANPVNEDDRSDYFDSMYHSAAVVGINTSAMIESAIVGRPVFTIRSPRFADTQTGTLHFHYLLPENGGFLRVSSTLGEHIAQLDQTLQNPDQTKTELERFVASFVRPHGTHKPATPIVADAIETLNTLNPKPPEHTPPTRYPFTALLWAVGTVHDLARRRRWAA
jgi:hypothetical protein